jgi:putative ABC transport system ATP-binding protein
MIAQRLMAMLTTHNLKKSFAGPDGARVDVVDVGHFELAAGQQVALHGESGSGKTTLLHLIAGILQPDAGDIELDGRTLSRMSEGDRDRLRATHIGYVFQTFNLLQGYSAIENIELAMMLGRGDDRAFASSLLERVGLSNRARYKPRQLSVGQQQRVAIARALSNRPCLVLADEPTGNLDPAGAAGALTLLRDLCRDQNAALLLVTHDRRVLSQFDDVRDLADLNRAAATAGSEPAS